MEPKTPNPPPARPTVTEAVTTAPKVAQPGESLCRNEGWRWITPHHTLYAGLSPDVPMSVYCVLPRGHAGKHVSKPRVAAVPSRRRTYHVYQWSDE